MGAYATPERYVVKGSMELGKKEWGRIGAIRANRWGVEVGEHLPG